MNLNKSYLNFEKPAREYCAHLGLDPDELEQYPDPNGYAVCRRRARWMNYAHAIYSHWLMNELVKHGN